MNLKIKKVVSTDRLKKKEKKKRGRERQRGQKL